MEEMVAVDGHRGGTEEKKGRKGIVRTTSHAEYGGGKLRRLWLFQDMAAREVGEGAAAELLVGVDLTGEARSGGAARRRRRPPRRTGGREGRGGLCVAVLHKSMCSVW